MPLASTIGPEANRPKVRLAAAAPGPGVGELSSGFLPELGAPEEVEGQQTGLG